MKVLYIAPIPPPINGQSLASKVFLQSIEKKHDVMLININKQRPKSFFDQLSRAFAVVAITFKTFLLSRKADRIYLTIAESRLGNLKDILLYIACYRKLNRMTIHLHGGAGMIKIMSKKDWLQKINVFFLKRIRNVVILGESHRKIYDGIVEERSLFIVPNFAEDYLYANVESVKLKFQQPKVIEFLFLSNLIYGKGYKELLEAYTLLKPAQQERIKLNFAGEIKTEEERLYFERIIKDYKNVCYHGIVQGKEKKMLFHNTHVFCLPTYYPFEGQPISILEAYASGCVVMSTYHSGIPDIFQGTVNGYVVEAKSVTSIVEVMERIITDNDNDLLHDIAFNNLIVAEKKYRVQNHCNLLTTILEN